MEIKKEEIVEFFQLKKTGNKGWFLSLNACPFCGKEEHLAIILDSKVPSFTCKRCMEHGSLFVLLKKVGKLDLISKYQTIKLENKLENKFEEEDKKELILECPTVDPPMGFKYVEEDKYLKLRGFDKYQIKLFNVGISDLDPILKQDYIIFLVKEEGEIKGYVARSRKDKKWIELYNQKLKEKGISKKYLRWVNSTSTDFAKLIFGIDEFIDKKTTTVILVEGITSKANIDGLLDLYSQNDIKCGATFGKKISLEQIQKLKNKGIKNIILFYDPDALDESGEYSMLLYKNFESVRVGFLKDGDPGDIRDPQTLFLILDKLYSPFSFKINKFNPKKLEKLYANSNKTSFKKLEL